MQSIDFAEGKSLELNRTDSFATSKKNNSSEVSIKFNLKKNEVQVLN